MIDPDGIQIQEFTLRSSIDLKDIPEYDFNCYMLDDEKDFKKYIADIEKTVRKSFEYKQFIKYIRENMNMNKCAVINGISNEDNFNIKIEIHHHPFTLYDISNIVYKKRVYYNESLEVQMVAKEVMELHYKLIVGLIPLSETAHELVHNSRLFIPVDKVMGRYQTFVQYYSPFIDNDLMETLDRIEKYSYEQHNKVLDTNILEPNKVSYNIDQQEYKLPEFNTITDAMIEQMNNIKNNNYMLPTVNEVKMIEENNDRKSKAICPIYWDISLKR
jgi:hypothetical protein